MSVAENVAPKDEELPAQYRKAREQEYENLLQSHLERQEKRDQQWWLGYGAYLNSVEWQQKRGPVAGVVGK
jgi:hypothetical protein